jgi:hypothetical protein
MLMLTFLAWALYQSLALGVGVMSVRGLLEHMKGLYATTIANAQNTAA